jgi:predicted negative regulator of RcsB-dependent stress response
MGSKLPTISECHERGNIVAEQRLSRKEIRQPDQFISFSVLTVDWMKQHTRHMLYGMVGVVVIAGLLYGWFAWRTEQAQQAEVLLYKAVKLLGSAESSTSKSQPDQAMAQLQTIVRDFGRTPAAAHAHWYLGHVYFEQGDYAAALTHYQQAQRRLPNDPERLVPALVLLDLGYAQEANGACDQARSSFDAVLQSSARWLRGEAYLGIGRCHERAGATAQALAAYDRALDDPEVGEEVRQTIEERLAILRPTTEAKDSQTAVPNKP